jgi:hypothetical protein
MRYEIRPRSGFTLKDIIGKINTNDLRIVGGQETLVIQAHQHKIEEVRRAITGMADLGILTTT